MLDKNRNPSSAIFCAWDDTVSYHLLTTRMPTSTSGDTSALVWHGMQDAAQRGLIFDLGGIATQGNAFFYSGFGGTVSPRHVATKTMLPVHLAHVLLRSFRGDQSFIY